MGILRKQMPNNQKVRNIKENQPTKVGLDGIADIVMEHSISRIKCIGEEHQ